MPEPERGGALAPPIFDRSVNPISTGEGRLSPPITTGNPQCFSPSGITAYVCTKYVSTFQGGRTGLPNDMREEGVVSRMMTSAMLSLRMKNFRILKTFFNYRVLPKFHAFKKILERSNFQYNYINKFTELLQWQILLKSWCFFSKLFFLLFKNIKAPLR